MALLIQILVKVSLVLLAAWGLTHLMSRSSAAARHLVWTIAILTALVMPLVQVVGPSWELAVLRSEFQIPSSGSQVTFRVPGSQFEVPRSEAAASETAMTPGTQNVELGTMNAEPEPVPRTRNVESGTQNSGFTFSAFAWIGIAWLIGAMVALGRLVVGIAWADWLTRRAVDVTEEGWLSALDDAAATLGVTRPIALKATHRTTIPVACGLWSPTVLLPAGAGDWPLERRRVVLLHELAHVARRDCLVQAVVHVARALYWFNPLVHVAAAKVRAEQERACDDLVLAAGTDGPIYADHLFEIARSFVSRRFPAWATLAMARPSQLEGRVVAILDDRRNRRPPTALVRAAMAAAAASLILSIGGLQLTAASAGTPAGTVARQAATDALIDPNPRPPRPDVQVLTGDIRPVDGGMTDVLVQAAVQPVEMLDEPDQDFDFDFDFDFSLPGATLFAQAAGQNAQAQTDTAVTDETRRRVADALMTALNDENAEVRAQALSSLASMRDERAIPGLLKALGDANANVRRRAIGALSQFSTPEAVQGIVSALKDADAEVRQQAVRQVANLASRRALQTNVVPSLLPLLRDAEQDVRVATAMALGNIADPAAIDALTAALKDTEPEVREWAARALGQIARGQRRGNFGPVPPLPPVRPGTAPPAAAPAPPRSPSAIVIPSREEILQAMERAQREVENLQLSEAELQQIHEDAQREAERALREFERNFNR